MVIRSVNAKAAGANGRDILIRPHAKMVTRNPPPLKAVTVQQNRSVT